ncbi:Small glutamine-rich tetratricopeptide repeat-containing protein 2 [Rhodotorula kratochvilovae]
MSSATAQKRAAFSILAFLDESLSNGAVKADDVESIQVASQCIAEAFGVSLEDDQDKRAYSLNKSLAQVLDEAASSTTAAPAPKEVTEEDKKEAEAAKGKGNQLMAKKDYAGAIAAYTDAIAKDARNPVYLSNRAAAHSSLQDFQAAVDDARAALAIDPTFSKAYSRLGHALFSLGEYAEAVEAYEKGLELDPSNATMKSSLATARSRLPAGEKKDGEDAAEGSVSRSGAPAAGAGAGPGAGGIPGFPGMGGGMPDLASMMNNPAIVRSPLVPIEAMLTFRSPCR